jgi:hypothetical protein
MAQTPNDGAIAERARNSLGLLTIPQLDAIGVTRQRRRTLVARGTLVPLGRGVFRHCAWSGSWERLVLAAVLEAGPGAVASHLSAAALWRFEGIGRGPVEVTVPAGRHPAPDHGTIHRSRDLVAADIEPRARIPVTTAARTLLDIAPRVDESRLEAVLDHAERRGIVWRTHLRWRLRELARQGRPGVPAVRRLLDRTEGRGLGDSWLEQEGCGSSRRPAYRCHGARWSCARPAAASPGSTCTGRRRGWWSSWMDTALTPRAATVRQRPSARRGSGSRDGTSCRSRTKT